jgi:hypothetical protein
MTFEIVIVRLKNLNASHRFIQVGRDSMDTVCKTRVNRELRVAGVFDRKYFFSGSIIMPAITEAAHLSLNYINHDMECEINSENIHLEQSTCHVL